MSKTNIEWATHVWNPVTGCNKVSPGCKFCYAEKMHKRLKGMKQAKYQQPFNEGAVPHYKELERAKDFPAGSRVFVNSMSDLFHENITGDFIRIVFKKMLLHDDKTYIILTKRADRMSLWFEWLQHQDFHTYQALTTAQHIWIGVSIENQEYANERVPHLLQIPMPVKILSCEPLLSSIDLIQLLNYPIPGTKDYAPPISWVIVGGESGTDARPLHPDWVENMFFQCKQMQIPFFFKQWGEWVGNQHMPDEVAYEKFIKAKKHTFGTGHFTTDVYRIGKKKAGNLLGKMQWLEFPKVYETEAPATQSTNQPVTNNQ